MRSASADERGASILVVSDDPLVREQARYGFSEGISISFVLDAREVPEALTIHEPSIVVVDMQTGNAGGFSLCREMAESGDHAGVPILMLLERPQDSWLARSAGATAFLVKPLGPGALAREVYSLSPALY